MNEKNDSLSWQAVLKANPDAQRGELFNFERLGLLKRGVYVDLSPRTAAAWLPGVKGKLNDMNLPTHFPVAQDVQKGLDELGAIRVTIIEVGDDGRIEVEAFGVRERIYASLFSNSIKGPDTEMDPEGGEVNYGGGWEPPPSNLSDNVG